MTVRLTSAPAGLRSAERQHSHARRCFVDCEQRATLDLFPVRVEACATALTTASESKS
jgi:hypothetical protein